MTTRPPASPLQSLLAEAESDLSRRLHEACEAEARGVSSESADEIRRLEDTLLSAAMAAERTIAARRHLQEAEKAAESPAAPDTQETPASPDSTSVREFADAAGRNWRAWPVTPDLAPAHRASRRSLGDFQEGWICFEALDSSARRRLPRPAQRWADLRMDDLPQLLEQAINVPPRKSRAPDLAADATAPVAPAHDAR